MAKLKDTYSYGQLKGLGGEADHLLDADLIAEIGDNFVRYDDGLQICWLYRQGEGSAWRTITLPRPFIDTNYRVFYAFEGSTGTTGVSTRSISANDKAISYFRSWDIAELGKVIWVVGKWK